MMDKHVLIIINIIFQYPDLLYKSTSPISVGVHVKEVERDKVYMSTM